MNRYKFAFAEVLAFVALTCALLASCSVFSRENMRRAMSAADVACVLASALTDSREVMIACKLHQDLRPAVDQLVSTKAAAERASACRSVDAGSP